MTDVIKSHWHKYYMGVLKKDFIDGLDSNFTMNGYPLDVYLMMRLGRSLDSSRGYLWEAILYKLSEYFNDNTYKNISNIKIESTGKKWIVDLAFERDGVTYLIEIKLGGDLDNKKSKSEAAALRDRKVCLLENGLATKVKTYLGIVCLNNGEASVSDWVMTNRLREGFSRKSVLVESELFDFISNTKGVFDFIKNTIQPLTLSEELNVIDKIQKAYL